MHLDGYQLPQELKMLQTTMKMFIAQEIVPLERQIDPDAIALPEEKSRSLTQKARDAGLWCLGEPSEYGGGGLGCFAMTVVGEEMSQHRNGLYGPGYNVFGPSIPPIPPIIYQGTTEQIERYVSGRLCLFNETG